MTQEVKRSYLEINSLKDLKEVQKPSGGYSLKLLDPVNFQLNKFFYKNVGKKHKWIDRLLWEESKWIKYVSNKNVKTYIFKKEDNYTILCRNRDTHCELTMIEKLVSCRLSKRLSLTSA